MNVVKRPLILDAGGAGGMAVLQIIRQSLPDITVTACDMDEYSPAQVLVKNFVQVLPADHPGYADNIMKIIKQYNIDFVVPSFHFGHQALAELKSEVFINNFEASIICHDKLKFYTWCKERGYKVPKTQLLSATDRIHAKVYIKPRFGAGSKNNFIVSTNDEFLLYKNLLAGGQDYLVQEFIDGELWQVEALNLDGKMIASATCLGMQVKAGNSTAALVSNYGELHDVARNILDDMRYNGLSNLEAISTRQGELVMIELNPRSGACLQYTAEAGCNTIAYLLTRDLNHLRPVNEGMYVSFRQVSRI